VSIFFFSGDRASDLGRIKTCEILQLPEGNGLLFRQTFGKPLRGQGENVFALKECANQAVCPVTNLRLYVTLSKRMGIHLNQGYLFRPTNNRGCVINAPFQRSAVAHALKKHLTACGLHEGETMHSFRSGCSITLSLLSVSTQEIAQHVGWKNPQMAVYYSQTDRVMNITKVAGVMAKGVSSPSPHAPPEAARLGQQFQTRNYLQDFKPAFT
jgi:hypothetical protein